MPADPWSRLLGAQQRSLASDGRLASLVLDPIKRGVPSIDVEGRLVSARSVLTIDGASTVTVGIHDPEWVIEDSGMLDATRSGRLPAIRAKFDGLAFRLVKVERDDPDVLELTFEDEVVALLREHDEPMSASRGSVTRAQFIEKMVREVKAQTIPFYSPEMSDRQATARPDYPDARPSRGTTGFDDGTRFKIKGQTADASQMREAATLLEVADQEGAPSSASGPRLALIIAAIGESEIRPVMNRAGSPYGGVLQGNVRAGVFRLKDTAGMARSFLRGGKGFQGGGAIALAKAHPDWTAGHIAYVVEGSRANFGSDAEAEEHYQQHADEARKIIAAWGSADGADNDPVVTEREFQFTRGNDGEREDSWQAATRLAEVVRWRFFAAGGAVAFVSDDFLITLPAVLTIDGPTAPGLLSRPTYDRDNGKPVQQTVLRAHGNRWTVGPGSVVALARMGSLNGRWIVGEIEQNILDATDLEITLVKPLPALKEPAPGIISRTTPTWTGDQDTLAGARRAVEWARSKIGAYKEEFGQNRGEDLDRLQTRFGLRGEPWCAMFATTAVTRGGVTDECRSARVAQIYQWAMAGTHGYQRGLRKNPKPGDLMLFDPPSPDDHVGIVENVRDGGTSVTTIEGNTSANQVARLRRVSSTGVFVRPDYPN
jgi:hypothetical protein